MQRFAQLYAELDQTNATSEKLAALTAYFAQVSDDDAAWAVWFLSGRRLKRLVKRAALWRWALEASGQPEWLLQECYQAVGDSAETIALILPDATAEHFDNRSLSSWVTSRLEPLAKLNENAQGELVKSWWQELPTAGRFVLNKLITGALRVGVSQRSVIRALAAQYRVDHTIIAHRLTGDWAPSAQFMQFVATGDGEEHRAAQPYPFYLASPLQAEIATLGAPEEWLAEWKWDGIRLQLMRRSGSTALWSRGEERLDGRFPELETVAAQLPDGTVIDGELIARDEQGRLSFATLQRRIGRKKPGPTLLQQAPVACIAYDLLEQNGEDLRQYPLQQRRERLQAVLAALASPAFQLSPHIDFVSWQQLADIRTESRERDVEGLMLKRRASAYGTGRTRGDWWKWKIDPYTIDAVLLYAQPGSGRRSNLLTDYTFAVWAEGDLVPVCKAYSGLADDEIARLDKWIRAHTKERFGPVRSVEPTHVFEIAFEGIQLSSRHKSGVAFRFPRIARWRSDLAIKDADTLDGIKALLVEMVKP